MRPHMLECLAHCCSQVEVRSQEGRARPPSPLRRSPKPPAQLPDSQRYTGTPSVFGPPHAKAPAQPPRPPQQRPPQGVPTSAQDKLQGKKLSIRKGPPAPVKGQSLGATALPKGLKSMKDMSILTPSAAPQRRAGLRVIFHRIDTNSNGFVELHELCQFVERHGALSSAAASSAATATGTGGGEVTLSEDSGVVAEGLVKRLCEYLASYPGGLPEAFRQVSHERPRQQHCFSPSSTLPFSHH